MFSKHTTKTSSPRKQGPVIFAALALLLLTHGLHGAGFCKEKLIPTALLNWLVEGSFHVLVADKSEQRLNVWKIENGEPTVVESFKCATGEKSGDKWVRGDMRTPEGVYFFCSVIDGRRLPSKYGNWAFTTDYPNFVDKRRGKSGDGIWLHGRDKPIGAGPDSNGCIALENEDLIKVSRYIRLQSTPLIIVKSSTKAPRSDVIEQERQLRNFIESWRQAWESRDIDRYMNHYSRNFQSCWLDYQSWKEKKIRLIDRYREIKVRLGKAYLYRQNGVVTAIFTQKYSSDGYEATGIKILYLVNEDGWKIYAEDYRHLVDDPFPVGPLLAALDSKGEAKPADSRPEFRIRLVSTDEPERDGDGDIETPRVSAPSRGVVLEKILEDKPAKLDPPQLAHNGKAVTWDSGSQRLLASLACAEINTSPVVIKPVARTHEPAVVPQPKMLARDPEPEFTTEATSAGDKAQPKKEADAGEKLAFSVKPWQAIVSTPNKRTLEIKEAGAPGDDSEEFVRDFLIRWKTAWEEKDLDSFMKMYHPKFQAGKLDYGKLRKSKRRYFKKYDSVRVKMTRMEVSQAKEGYRVKFLQSFQGDNYRDEGWKNMVLAGNKDKGLRILQESWTPR